MEESLAADVLLDRHAVDVVRRFPGSYVLTPERAFAMA
jgi:hypothetical protein